jgi:hypothetical protein
MYVVAGIVMRDMVKDYIKELEDKLMDIGVSPNGLRFTIEGSVWLGLFVLSMSSLLWPISLITVLLKAEWEYSRLSTEATKE